MFEKSCRYATDGASPQTAQRQEIINDEAIPYWKKRRQERNNKRRQIQNKHQERNNKRRQIQNKHQAPPVTLDELNDEMDLYWEHKKSSTIENTKEPFFLDTDVQIENLLGTEPFI